jgi:two-component system chemotaxis sensor kinase CheA
LVSLRAEGGPRIEGLAGADVIRLRGRLVPVVFLDVLLGLRPTTAARENGTVVLVRVDDHEFGLVVDGTQTSGIPADALAFGGSLATSLPATRTEAASLSTIVVKPIGSLLGQLGIYSGATVLGDGGVVLILDLRGILRAAELPAQPRRSEAETPSTRSSAESYLVCRTNAGRRIAVPIDTVVRLEQFAGHELQNVGGKCLVRRGDLFTPVVDADSLLGVHSVQADADALKLVVLDDRCGGIGLAVRQIVDVTEADSMLQPSLASPGVAGTLAVGGIATEVLDLGAFLPSTGARL